MRLVNTPRDSSRDYTCSTVVSSQCGGALQHVCIWHIAIDYHNKVVLLRFLQLWQHSSVCFCSQVNHGETVDAVCGPEDQAPNHMCIF